MSEPIHTEGRAAEQNVSPHLIEMPPNPVGINMIPHHMAGENGSLVRTGKIEVRFDGSSLPTRNDKRKTIMWEKVAYNAAHQVAYYRQVHDNLVARAEQYERAYTEASRNYQSTVLQRDEAKRDMDRLRPLINEAFRLKRHWAYFLLPTAFKKLVGTA